MPLFNINRTTTTPRTLPPEIASSPLAPRTFRRNRLVDGDLREMERHSLAGGASQTIIHAANAELRKWAFNYHTGLPKKVSVEKPPAADANGKRIMDMTVLMNVSGHAGDANTHAFAKSNKYMIRVTLPDGKVLTMSNVPRSKDVEYATAQDISFELQRGKTIIEAWPVGSAGVGGYVEGRRYEVYWTDPPFRPDATGQDPSDPHSRYPFHEP